MTVLARSLRTSDVVMLVLGMMIGSGVFVVPETTVRLTGGYAGPALLAWVVGGALSLLGALTYAELGAMKPHAGGLYVFIRDAFGALPAFLYGWMLFFVMGAGIVAALAVAATSYISRLIPLSPLGASVVAIAFISVLAAVNVIGTRRSARLTNVTTALKVGVILVVSIAFVAAPGVPNPRPIWPETVSMSTVSGFGAAMLGVLWAYEGWQWATFVVGETVDAQRVFPRAMIIGTVLGVFGYVLANAGYLAALGPEAMGQSTAVAADAALLTFGPAASTFVALLAIVTIVGAANGLLLTVPRVFFAMANDGIFFRTLARVHPRFGTPAASIVAVAFVGALLTLSGTFDQLLTYVVFTGWIFYMLAGLSLFVFRRREPHAARPYRVPGYPLTPLLFVISALAVVLNTIIAQPARSAVGLGVVALGVPAYYLWARGARSVALSLVLLAVLARPAAAQAPAYDLVIINGRVIDPESKLDAVRSVGITNGRIAAISASALRGKRTIDAKGLVVAPGFVDLHVHGQNDENYRLYAMDGVTTALEMEVGTDDVPRFYAERDGKALINYGVSAGHVKARMSVMQDAGAFLPLGAGGHGLVNEAQIADITAHIETGLTAGALGIGMGLQYTPAATRYEVLEAFRLAARYKRPVFVHTRAYGATEPGSSVESYLEVIGAAAITGAPLHIVHLNSTSLASTPKTLAMVRDARARGLDVTAEAYPYSAGMTEISSPLLDQYVNGPDSMFSHFMLAATGERLTRATFLANRKPGGMIIMFLNTPEMEAMAMTSPLTSIASDGRIENGKGHPRTAGTSARTLGYYVRESKQIDLTEAIRKLARIPAQRLQSVAPEFRRKGRIAVGADADISMFDPAMVIDKSTYLQPAIPSVGFKHVLVNGVSIVEDGVLRDGIHPGRAMRAPFARPGQKR